MKKYIAILRGINVSGHNKIEMKGLKTLFEELGFEEVITYIQSGNVIFKTRGKLTEKAITKKIEAAILAKYSLTVPLIIRSQAEMEHLAANNPFISQSGIDVEKLHVTFLSDPPEEANLENVKDVNFPPDSFILKDKEVFLYCPGGYGETKLTNNFFEKKLKVTATTRNWKTVNKLVELANK